MLNCDPLKTMSSLLPLEKWNSWPGMREQVITYLFTHSCICFLFLMQAMLLRGTIEKVFGGRSGFTLPLVVTLTVKKRLRPYK